MITLLNFSQPYTLAVLSGAALLALPLAASVAQEARPSGDAKTKSGTTATGQAARGEKPQSKAEKLKAAAAAPLIRAIPGSPERAAVDASKTASEASPPAEGSAQGSAAKQGKSETRRPPQSHSGVQNSRPGNAQTSQQSAGSNASRNSQRRASITPPRRASYNERAGRSAAISPGQTIVLRAGTPLRMRLTETVTTKKGAAKVGQRIAIETAAPVIISGVELIAAGSQGFAEITSVRNKGAWGKSGRLEARATQLTARGKNIHLTGNFNDRGKTGTAGVAGVVALGVVTVPVAPLAGFLVTGTSATLPEGGVFTAFVADDVTLSLGGGGSSGQGRNSAAR